MKLFTKINVLLVVLIFIIIFLFTFNKENVVIENKKNENLVNTNTLTMMYETKSNSGEYQVASDNVWPGDEYIFNETLSKCENGSNLSWDNENKKVLLQADNSDKCYVFFDKYIMPQITNVEATNVTSDSIMVSVTVIPGDGDIASYYYSINDGKYVSSESNSYTFNNLEAETSYSIKVYVIDINERKSVIYSNNFNTLNLNLISFKVDDVIYYSEPGMTWYEWVISKYNNGGFFTCCGLPSDVIAVDSYLRLRKKENLYHIDGNDIIVDNDIYYTEYVGTCSCI